MSSTSTGDLRPALTTLTEEESMFREAVRDFAQAEVAPRVHEMDEKQEMDPALVEQLFELGLMGIEIPEAHGGTEASFFTSILVVEELSKVDPAVGVLVDVQNTLVINAFNRWASEAQKAEWFPRLASDTVGAYALSEAGSGSDAFALACRAEKDGDDYVLNGHKLWITNGNEAEVFRFPARPEGGGNAGGEALEVEIWGDRVQAVAPHPEGDAWLSDFLGAPVRLVYQPDRSHRPTDPHFAPGAEVSLADGYPILVLTRASLDELNRRLAESGSGPLPMDRFRPNLVVEGPVTPHAEDGWRRFQVGGVAMAGVKRCARCAVTTVDPATGARGKEPLRTLAHYRRDLEGRVFFGQNVVPLGVGAVAVGDRVELLEEGWVGP